MSPSCVSSSHSTSQTLLSLVVVVFISMFLFLLSLCFGYITLPRITVDLRNPEDAFEVQVLEYSAYILLFSFFGEFTNDL